MGMQLLEETRQRRSYSSTSEQSPESLDQRSALEKKQTLGMQITIKFVKQRA